jgi:hypothetical protein
MSKKDFPCARMVREFMNQSALPRNQIASMSGLTNTYLRDMEQGNATNVERRRIISLGVALSLKLEQIDYLLKAFDRTPLSDEDIPVFFDISKRMTVSRALHPLHSQIIYELWVNAVRRIPGNQISCLQAVASSLRSPGHSHFIFKKTGRYHPILPNLMEANREEKRKSLIHLVKHHKVEHFACRNCLEDYVLSFHEPQEKEFRIRHIASLSEFLKNNDNFYYYISDVCPSFQFNLKFPAEGEGQNDKVWYMGKLIRTGSSHMRGRLVGFATDNPTVVGAFKAEVEVVREGIVKHLFKKEKILDYLETLQAKAKAA